MFMDDLTNLLEMFGVNCFQVVVGDEYGVFLYVGNSYKEECD